MDCPVLVCNENSTEAGTISKFLNSFIIKNTPKKNSYLHLNENGLSFNSHTSEGKRELRVDFLKGPMGWRLKRPEHEKQLKKAIGKTSDSLTIFDGTAGMLGDSMIFLSLGHKVIACEQSKIIYLLIKDACKRAENELPFLKNLKLVHGNSAEIYKSHGTPDLVYLDPLYPENSKSSKRSGDVALLRTAIELESITDIGDEIFHEFRASEHKKIILKRPIKAPLICNKINYQIKGKSTRFDIYI